jgi:hypothetical protein
VRGFERVAVKSVFRCAQWNVGVLSQLETIDESVPNTDQQTHYHRQNKLEFFQ